ncbi:hypothetical protein ACJX0J_014304, partial [Zea mays]
MTNITKLNNTFVHLTLNKSFIVHTNHLTHLTVHRAYKSVHHLTHLTTDMVTFLFLKINPKTARRKIHHFRKKYYLALDIYNRISTFNGFLVIVNKDSLCFQWNIKMHPYRKQTILEAQGLGLQLQIRSLNLY